MSQLGLRLAAAGTILFTFLLVLLTTVQIQEIRAVQERQLRNQAESTLREVEEEFHFQVTTIRERLEPLSRIRELRFRVQPGPWRSAAETEPLRPLDPIGLKRFLEESLPIAGNGLDLLEVFSPGGELWASASREGYREPEEGEGSPMKGEAARFSVGFRNLDTGVSRRWLLTVAVPIHGRSGSMLGVLVGGVTLRRIVERLEALSGARVEIFPREDRSSSVFSQGGLETGREGVFWREETVAAIGAGRLAGIRVLVPAEAVLSVEQALVASAVRAGGLAVAASALFWLLLGVGMTRRLKIVTAAAEKIGKGEEPAGLEALGNDEIALLSETLHSTAKELVRQRERLARTERLAAWRDAARMLAHELKNAITPINLSFRTALRALEKGEKEREVVRRALDAVEQELENLKSLVAEFSDFARLPSPRWSPVLVQEGIAKAVALYDSTGTRFECKLPPDLPAVRGDAELLDRVWKNLIANAVEAAGGRGVVWIRGGRGKDGNVVVEIENTGESGRRGSGREAPKAGGWGIGLVLAERIITEHNGRIEFAPREDGGAIVTVLLPRAGGFEAVREGGEKRI